MSVPKFVLAAHLAELRLLGQTPGTIEARRLAIERMARLIATPLLEATPDDLAAWRAGLGVTPNTVVHYAVHARGFYAWAVRTGLCERNPTAGLLVPPLSRGLPRPITEDDLLLAVTGAPRPVRQYLVLASCTGLRAREIAYLRREAVLDTMVPAALLVTRAAAKGGRERVVPMSSFVVAELRAGGLPRAGWVFPRLDGRQQPNSPARISQASNAYLHSVGISATLHQLRHRFATVLYAGTLDLRLVQTYLGHARPESSAGYTAYNHVSGVAAIEAMPVPVPRLAAAG